jgi:hypothetical protein
MLLIAVVLSCRQLSVHVIRLHEALSVACCALNDYHDDTCVVNCYHVFMVFHAPNIA